VGAATGVPSALVFAEPGTGPAVPAPSGDTTSQVPIWSRGRSDKARF
jgi:hypothetical protein